MTSSFDIPVRDAVKRVPVVLAHRGASRAAPENSLRAFSLATALGADGVELDARRCADGVVVVHHDAHLDGRDVVALGIEEMRATHPEVPTLDEALDVCEGIVNIEIKNFPNEPDYDPAEAVAATVAETVVCRNMLDRVIVSSFTTDALDRVRAVDRRVRTGWLTLPAFSVLDALALARPRGYDAIHPERRAVLPDAKDVVAAAHDAGLLVNVWTVDDPDEMTMLAAASVDGIITNDPELARRVLPVSPT